MIIPLVILELILFFTNYTPHTILTGWDNMMPELNFGTNLLRGIFGAWQQYRGLGLADGMSHAADTLHTICVWILSFVLPQELLRYAFTFGMHLAGGIGIYVLLLHILPKTSKVNRRIPALIGAIFYMLNFATIQMFYTPFEAFSIHFAALPWLAFTLTQAIKSRSKHDILLFFGVSLAATPVFFVPTLLLPTVLLLATVGIFTVLQKQETKVLTKLHIAIVAGVGFILINAFWLAPYLVNLPKNAPVIINAKINQMSSSEDFAQNQAFGNVSDVVLLRGFSLNFQDYTADGTPVYLMQAWRTFLATPLPTAIGIVFACFALFGIGIAVRKRSNRAFVALFIMGFIILGNNIPGIKEAFDIVRKISPTIGEALRFPFTKFSLLFALSYSVLVSVGIFWAFERLEKAKRPVQIIIAIFIICAVLWQAAPAFTGQFISPNLRITQSKDYQTFYTYMQSHDPNGRILVLPQQSYWSWKLYRDGYRGSGFMWFAIPQAIMDRAFDPWSSQNENAYWELSYALYKKDTQMFSSVLSKYDINEIVIDTNQATYGNYRSLFIDESETLLSDIPGIKPEKTFGAISLYSVAGTKPAVRLAMELPNVFPAYRWTDNDAAYRELGDYTIGNNSNAIIYPFRSLFTKRSAGEREFTVTENDKTIALSSQVEATEAGILKSSALVYDSTRSGDLKAQDVQSCGLSSEGSFSAENLSENGDQFLRLTGTNQKGCLSFDMPTLEHKNGYLVVVESRNVTGPPLTFSLINDTAKHVELETYLSDNPNWTKDYFILPPLAQDGLGYNPYISNESIGQNTTMNDIRSIRVYKIPYGEMIHLSTNKIASSSATPRNDIKFDHPNPSYYRISLPTMTDEPITLVLSQSFDPDWIAVTPSKQFPYLVPAGNHVLVNNWENGWVVNGEPVTIYLFFWPQILEWLGFILLPIPFLWALKRMVQ